MSRDGVHGGSRCRGTGVHGGPRCRGMGFMVDLGVAGWGSWWI